MVKWNKRQIEKLAEISSDVGLVALASVVLPAVLDKFNLLLVTLGLIITILCWIISVWLLKRR